MTICRLCLWEGEENCMVFINREADLLLKIRNCISPEITDNDNFTKTICIFCVKKINDWCDFRESCLKSQEILKMPPASKTIGNEGTEYSFVKDQSDQSWKFSDDDDSSCKQDSDEDITYDDDFTTNERKIEFTEYTYSCEICSEKFNYCLDFIDHQSVHDGQLVFKCEKCPEVFSLRADLVNHDNQHKRPCPKCGKLILLSSMKLHLVQHTDRHMCSKCSHRFASKATLQQHIVTVHTNIRDHICDVCGKRFACKTSMNVHLKIHSEKRLYSCKLCNYKGRTSSAIYVHMSTHANEVHVCEVCSKSFKSNRNLSDHLRRVHSKEKKHQCNYCKKKFVDKYMVTVHMRTHTGVRPFKCELCDKAFIRSDSLKEHVLTHGYPRALYDCKSCAKKFTSRRGAARHQCSLGS